ncbi:hypothetical protein OsI_01901 [Oryza sativa Indica Group]|uniref:Uncharacterized protein n=1 Tax=Oryza sativa subsp. indica TaxID=39946 RepID=B8A7Z0_ORYSI|nr:hypothetical protein OsI_01901 [Oryza sativa Indica Group]
MFMVSPFANFLGHGRKLETGVGASLSVVEERGKGGGGERSIGGDLSEDTTGEVYDIEYRCSEKSAAKEKGGSGKVYVIGGDLSEDAASKVRGIKYFCSEKSAAEERVQVRQDSSVSMVPCSTIIFYSLEIEEIQRSIFGTAAR